MDKITRDKDFSLEELKEDYEKFKNQYNLPEFYELNKLFDIEDIEIETDFLLRKIRRAISERISSYSRFVEIFLNPTNAPMFFFKLLKKLDAKEKETLGMIYEQLGSLEIETILLDLEYSEEKEAEFIKKLYNVFDKELRISFLSVIKRLSTEEKNNKNFNGSYFGWKNICYNKIVILI